MSPDVQGLAAHLAKVPLFEGIPESHLQRIAAQMSEFTFQPGTAVIEADRPSNLGRLYVILAGTAVATVNGTQVATFGPGDHFGEMSLLDTGSRSADVTATSELQVAGLASWNFRPMLHEEPELAMHIIESLVARLRHLNQQIERG